MAESTTNDDNNLYTTRKLAKILNMKQNTLERWRSYKKGPKPIKLGKIVLYKKTDVEKYLENLK